MLTQTAWLPTFLDPAAIPSRRSRKSLAPRCCHCVGTILVKTIARRRSACTSFARDLQSAWTGCNRFWRKPWKSCMKKCRSESRSSDTAEETTGGREGEGEGARGPSGDNAPDLAPGRIIRRLGEPRHRGADIRLQAGIRGGRQEDQMTARRLHRVILLGTLRRMAIGRRRTATLLVTLHQVTLLVTLRQATVSGLHHTACLRRQERQERHQTHCRHHLGRRQRARTTRGTSLQSATQSRPVPPRKTVRLLLARATREGQLHPKMAVRHPWRRSQSPSQSVPKASSARFHHTCRLRRNRSETPLLAFCRSGPTSIVKIAIRS